MTNNKVKTTITKEPWNGTDYSDLSGDWWDFGGISAQTSATIKNPVPVAVEAAPVKACCAKDIPGMCDSLCTHCTYEQTQNTK